MNLHERIRDLLAELPDDRRRTLRYIQSVQPGTLTLEGQTVVDFASNDYLGLSQHHDLLARSNQWAKLYGAGARASRLISGNLERHEQLEQKLARLKGSETALIMGGGFQTNSTVIAALLDRRLASDSHCVQLFADRLCHASFHFGVSATSVKQHRYRHNDLDHLSGLLEKSSPNGLKLIATESLFSMDGDQLDVTAIRKLARQHNAMLYVDEAHATGLFGESGMGLMSGQMHRDDVVIGTFGKALGSYGSYVACSTTIRDYLINCCSGLIYSTGLSPMLLGAIEWALETLPKMESERQHLNDLSSCLRDALHDLGLDTLNSTTHIIPVVVKDERRVMELATNLLVDGFLVGAIRPPTVPVGSARLRISLSAAHTNTQVASLIDSIRKHSKIEASS